MNTTKRIDAHLLALGPDLESELAEALTTICREVRTGCTDSAGASVIFCPSNVEQVARLRAAEPQATIIVVSRHPEVNDWLDSIEAGADDYCAAPFEPSQLQWILQSTPRSSRMAA